MGFYLRKAFSFGPLRLNLSRSGLGASIGVKGARIGVGPRGRYIHLGRGGLYYRQSLTSPTENPSRSPYRIPESDIALPEVESRPVEEMQDSSSTELLTELNRVQSRIPILPFAIIAFILMIVAAMMVYADGHVSVQNEGALPWRLYLALGVSVVLGVPLILYARHRDVARGTAILTYDLDEAAQPWFSGLAAVLNEFGSCQRVWHIPAEGATDDWKRHAGANALVKRKLVVPTTSVPRRIQCNFQVPALQGGRQTLYFFPDRLLVYENSRVGAVTYSDLRTSVSETMFREESTVPSPTRRM